jgi:hypothetical protein
MSSSVPVEDSTAEGDWRRLDECIEDLSREIQALAYRE